MLKIIRADLFSLAPQMEAVVNPTNCTGAMGAGLALRFKETYPDNYRWYRGHCLQGHMKPGHVYVYDRWHGVPGRRKLFPRYIINLTTKDHWKQPSKLEYVTNGLEALTSEIKNRRIRSIAIPALGCGLGGLDWKVVKIRMLKELKPLSDHMDIVVLEPM